MRRRTRVAVVQSVVAAALVVVASFGLPPVEDGPEPSHRTMVGWAFILVCLLGLSMALRPGWLRRWRAPGDHVMEGWGEGGEDSPAGPAGRRRLGHHPDCPGFDGHRCLLLGRHVCAGCSGLSLGAVLAIALALLELASPGSIVRPGQGVAWLLAGLALVTVALVQDPSRPWHGPRARLVLNASIVVGAFGVVMGSMEMSGRVELGLFALAMALVWMDARIELSHVHHAAVCAGCPQACKTYYL